MVDIKIGHNRLTRFCPHSITWLTGKSRTAVWRGQVTPSHRRVREGDSSSGRDGPADGGHLRPNGAR